MATARAEPWLVPDGMSETEYPFNPAGFIIHSCIHVARPDVACRYQVEGLAGGVPLHYPSEEVQQKTIEQGLRIVAPNGHARVGMEWPSLLKQLERERGTSYRT